MLKNGKRKGSALLLVVLVFMVISVLSTLMVITLDNTLFEVTTYATQMQASYMSQEAQEAAVAALMDRKRDKTNESLIEQIAKNLKDSKITLDDVRKWAGQDATVKTVGYDNTGDALKNYEKNCNNDEYVPLNDIGKVILREARNNPKPGEEEYEKEGRYKGRHKFYHKYYNEATGENIYLGCSYIELNVITARYHASASGTDGGTGGGTDGAEAWAWVRISTEVVDRRSYSRSDRTGADSEIVNDTAGAMLTSKDAFHNVKHFTYESSVLMLCRNPLVQLFNMTPDKVNKLADPDKDKLAAGSSEGSEG